MRLKETIPNSLKALIHSHSSIRSEFVPAKNDVMLVSYPKSGNTWVRALIANIISPGLSLSDMEKLIPNIYASSPRDLSKAYIFSFGGRVIKSHEAFRPFYGKMIYIYRDPRDVMISYFYYLKKKGRFSESSYGLEDFSDPFVDGKLDRSGKLDRYGTWYQNVKSWKELKNDKILFLSYESLLKNTKHEFKRILEFIGEQVESNSVDRAVSLCSLDLLRDKEVSIGNNWRENKSCNKNVNFFRKGEAGQWRNYDQKIFNKLTKNWGDLILELGYEG